jgi:hypothetical protein
MVLLVLSFELFKKCLNKKTKIKKTLVIFLFLFLFQSVTQATWRMMAYYLPTSPSHQNRNQCGH